MLGWATHPIGNLELVSDLFETNGEIVARMGLP